MKTTATALLLVIALAAGACDPDDGSTRLTVMTRNVYVGTDVDAVMAATDGEDLVGRILVAWQELHATDFTRRAEALADEIEAAKPDIVGLQEITTFRVQSPGDVVVGGTIPATQVAWDYLEILLDALEERGLDYRVVGVVQDADVELPLITAMSPPAFDDVRMTDYDAVLVSSRVTTANVVTANFEAKLPVPMPMGAPIEIPRGYVAFDATVEGSTFRFVSSHLEPASNPLILPIQQAQAAELIEAAGSGAAIVVGDLNSRAADGASYLMLKSAGLRDAWLESMRGAAGATCCFHTSLVSGLRQPDERVDLVLFRPSTEVPMKAEKAELHGTQASTTAGGIYPSDHVGVSARFTIGVN